MIIELFNGWPRIMRGTVADVEQNALSQYTMKQIRRRHEAGLKGWRTRRMNKTNINRANAELTGSKQPEKDTA